MKLIRAARPDVLEYVLQADPSTFARSQTPIARFDLHTNGIAESMNSKFADERALPRFTIFQQIELSVMHTIQEQKALAEARLAKVDPQRMHFSVTPWAEEQIKHSLKFAKTGYEVAAGESDQSYAVYTLSDRGTRWLVNLSTRHCSCGRFSEIQIPCVHALAVLAHQPNLPYTAWSLCHDVYKTANWAKCYSTTLNPVNISTLVPLPNIKPPVPKKQRGRPKGSKRILGADERRDRQQRPRNAPPSEAVDGNETYNVIEI